MENMIKPGSLAVSFFRQLHESGEDFIFAPEASRRVGAAAGRPAEAVPAGRGADGSPHPPAPESAGAAAPLPQAGTLSAPGEPLEEFGRRISGCTLCRLSQSRNNFVFGAGCATADLMFVGEGPGFEEDRQGLPFVGASGQLLTRIIASIGFTREEVYIGNLVKCRPPRNRDPEPDEISTCVPYLLAQIEKIEPKVLVTLGRFSACYFHGREAALKHLRGLVSDFRGVRVVSTYHPAALLRNQSLKRDTWEDMLLARRLYEELGGKPSSGRVFVPAQDKK
ncbi:MAG: uracil-DNA glycosylase [Candidatus Glassbacteria bacterium]|nr:uracil-DNA glycosylase [Candidatus Glassbacteria bacterium]